MIPILDVGDFKDTSREENIVTKMENHATEICSSIKHLDEQELLALAITVGFSAIKSFTISSIYSIYKVNFYILLKCKLFVQ